jgi:hypothetical protein
MKYRLLLALLATAILSVPLARAQDDDDDDDQEFDYFAYFARAHSNITFGFKATQGAKVKFGNLGTILPATPVGAIETDPVKANLITRTYNNGTVGADTYRPEETGTSSGYVSLGNGRYQLRGGEVDGGGVPFVGPDNAQINYVKGEYVAYVPGDTRNYSFNAGSQVVGNTVTMTQYSVDSQGEGFDGKRSLSGGVEMQAERLFTDPAKRFRFSLVAGLSLNGINSKRTGTVKSTLHVLSDTYSFVPNSDGSVLPTSGVVYPYTTPDIVSKQFPDSAGVLISAPNEQSPLLNVIPTRAPEVDDEDGADVNGVWEVKGAYLVLRIGPELSASVTPNLSLSASAGVAGAYVGTNYTAIESAVITNDPTVTDATLTTGALTSEENKFLAGYYANLDASWAVNERTGFYAGISYESYGDFDQTLAGRTARIDLGGNASLRGGLNIKF